MIASVKMQEDFNGLTNVSARFHQNSTEFNIFVDPLVWTAKEAGTDCWAEGIISDSSFISNNLEQIDFGWNVGLRIGAGYGMKHDQWDTRLFYTLFRTQGNDHASRGAGSMHSSFLGNFYVGNPEGAGITGPSYESASIRWTIRFQMFDWDLGRKFWASESLALRPFMGIKGGLIHQFIHSKWYKPNLTGTDFFNLGIENIKNNFWGIGPQVGIDTKWVLSAGKRHCFSIFDDISGALMYGHWAFSDVFDNDINQKIVIDSQPLNGGASMVRVFSGLEWNADVKQDCYRFSTKVGYEMQFWLNQLQFYSFTGGRLGNQLTLQGVTLEFCCDF